MLQNKLLMSADDGQMTLFTSPVIVQPQRKSWDCMMKTAYLAHSKLSFIPLVGSHRLVFRVIVGEVLRQELPRFGGVSGIDWRSIKTTLAPAASCWWASHRCRSAGRWRRGSQSKCMISPRHDSRHPFQKLAAPYTSRVMSPPHSLPPTNPCLTGERLAQCTD